MTTDTLPPTSRRQSQFGSIHTFGELGDFLREAIADEDARQFSESMAQVAARADEVVAALARSRKRAQAAPALMDLMTVLREHRAMVLGLGLGWRGLYEYAGYLQSLNNFRILIGEWLLHAVPWDDEIAATDEDVRQLAWRTLGDGMLLLEMYEQWLQHGGESEPAVREPQLERVRQWWHKLRR
jgi:hypothetical protein